MPTRPSSEPNFEPNLALLPTNGLLLGFMPYNFSRYRMRAPNLASVEKVSPQNGEFYMREIEQAPRLFVGKAKPIFF